MSDKNGNPVGTAVDVKGHATVVHPDGTQEVLSKGVSVYQGDIIETDAAGAVNITFNDDTVFAVSNNAKMTIDEFVYDANKDGEGEADISIVRGVFVYTSGFVGKEDHDDVHIKTPAGSIGIRGTTLTGYVPAEGSTDSPSISLIEGAIVVHPNQGADIVLDESRETVQLNSTGTQAENIGVIPPEQMIERFNVVRSVAPTLFTPVTDAANTIHIQQGDAAPQPTPTDAPQDGEAATTQQADPNAPSSPSIEGNALPPGTELPPPEQGLPNNETIMLQEGKMDVPLTLMGDALGTNLNNMAGMPLNPNGPLGPNIFNLAPGPQQLIIPMGNPIGSFAPLPPNFSFINFGGIGSTNFYTPQNIAPIAKTLSFNAIEQPGIEGGTQTLDSSRFFADANGDALSYIITGTTDPFGVIQSASFNTNNQLTFQIGNTLSADATIHIFVSAFDGKLYSPSIDFSFTVYNLIDGGLSITTSGDTITVTPSGLRLSALAGSDTVTISGSNNIVFGGIGDDTVTISGDNNKAYGEAGDDNLTLGSTVDNSLISGGAGNDTLVINTNGNTGNQVFGGDGSDSISFANTNVVNQIQSAGALMIDAGSGFDSLSLHSNDSLDLSLVTASNLHNIEKISGVGGSNAISLDIRDIFEHSESGYLFIHYASTLTVTNTTGLANLTLIASNTTNPYDPAVDLTSYNAYSNGAQTLYVDTSIATVTGL